MASIIIVDDHPILTEGLVGFLAAAGHEILKTCRSAAEALSAIEQNPPEIVIADVTMPEMSGIDMLRTLRDRGNAVPVILYTATISGPDARLAIEGGVNAIIAKDADPEDLLECLRTVERGQNWIDREIMASAMRAKTPDARWPALSPAERRIAVLAAEGLHNAEIAERTGLTEGTVKVHLNRVFRKLGISSRMMLIKEYSSAA